jgi:hypothetical protein
VNASLSANKVREVFEYEMQLNVEGRTTSFLVISLLLPCQAIQMFRTLAFMIVTVGYFNAKRKSPLQSHSTSWEKTVIGWFDILRIFTELYEVHRRFYFMLFLRKPSCFFSRLSEKLHFRDLIKEGTITMMKNLSMKRCHRNLMMKVQSFLIPPTGELVT